MNQSPSTMGAFVSVSIFSEETGKEGVGTHSRKVKYDYSKTLKEKRL